MMVGLVILVFHLDNNEIPVITYIETPQVEKSGAFEIRFVPFDQERDSLSFKFEWNSNGVYVDGWTYGTLKVIGNEIKSGVYGINFNYGVGYLEVVNNVIRDNSGWGMYLYGVSGGVARGNLVSGNGSGVYIWDYGGVNFEMD